ncbi:MAG: IclR family transcriptional regulator [Terriglobia bacterium]
MQVTRKAPRRRRRPKAGISGLQGKAALAEQYYSKSVARALDVLECFSDDEPSLSLRELGNLARLPEPSLHRILLTLESRGYLVRNSDGAYQLSRKLLFGKLVERAEKLVEAARPELQSLALRFNETTSLAYLYGAHIQVVDKAETFHEIRATNALGRLIPPHCSALGKAITAFQDRALMDRIVEVYGLSRRAERTIVDRQSLLVEFDTVRAAGYAVDDEESVAGAICVGAPIRLESGRVAAALSISTPKTRMTAEREKEMAEAVVESARRIAATLRTPEND